MKFAEQYSDVLPETHRDALFTAYTTFLDEFLQDDDGIDFYTDYLPPVYRHRYVDSFWPAFLGCMYRVGYKLVDPPENRIIPSSVGEVLALELLITFADVHLETQSIEKGTFFDDFKDVAFWDIDHHFLWDEELDGFWEEDRIAHVGLEYLNFETWFVPFSHDSTGHAGVEGNLYTDPYGYNPNIDQTENEDSWRQGNANERSLDP
jgi:hypothetical protein